MSSALEALAALRSAVDALLAAPDVFDGDDELHAFVVGAQLEGHRLTAALAPAVSRWERLGVWGTDGSLSAASRLARETHVSKPTARRVLRRARSLGSMPATAAALAEGELSPDHVDLFAKVNKPHRNGVFERDEETLVESCKTLLFDEAIHALHYWGDRADAETQTDDGPETKKRDRASEAHLHASETLDGNTVISGVLDPIAGEIFRNELDRLEHILYLADKENGSERTTAQRRAAALVEMATRSASTPADARRPKPLFIAHVGDETVRRLCELASGTVLRPDDLRNWVDDALLETVLFDGPTTVISVSQQRSFTGKLRTAIQARDRRCKHPTGCTTPAAKCDIDHIVEWHKGGRTSQFNGRAGCPPHNRHPDKRDTDPQPYPERDITRLDALRAKARWSYYRHLELEAAGTPCACANTTQRC